MSWLSSAFDSVGSLFGYEGVGSSIADGLSSVTGLFGGGDEKGGSGLSQLLIAGLGAYGNSRSSSDKLASDERIAEMTQANTMEQLKYKYDREFELAKLKLSSGSGSGSSGPSWAQQVAQANALEKYRQILAAKQGQVEAMLEGGKQVSNSYANMASVAQAPLTKRTLSL